MARLQGRYWEYVLNIHLIDGTYELFRHYFAVPSARDKDGREMGAVRGVLASLLGMMKEGATHVAVATDHVIESFRNDLWPGYKAGEAILLEQFPLLEEVLAAAGMVVWPMIEFGADDARRPPWLSPPLTHRSDQPRELQLTTAKTGLENCTSFTLLLPSSDSALMGEHGMLNVLIESGATIYAIK
jgi:hypothetical protein